MKIDAEKLLNEHDIVQVVERRISLKKNGGEYYGVCPFHADTKASLQVNQKKQVYKCFACNAGGDAIDFLTRLGSTFHEACEEINGGIMPEGATPEQREASKPKMNPNSWKHVYPAQAVAENFNHYKHGIPQKIWAYHTADSGVIGYVCRFDFPDGSKQTLPLVYATDGKRSEWRWMGFVKPRPLYNLHTLAANPKATVLLVEGEKTADAVQAQLDPSKTVVMTWVGGAQGITHADWKPIDGRRLILWGDNDKPGMDAMAQIGNAVESPLKRYVHVPKEYPPKWDGADKEWKDGELRKFVLDNIKENPQVIKEKKPEGPKNPPLPPVPSAPIQKPQDSINDNANFRILGYDKDENSRLVYYFFSYDAKAVIKLSPSNMTKSNLMMLAPINWWEDRFPAKTSKFDVDGAQQFLIATSHQVGIFKENYIRGRGAWVDDGRIVIHTGDMLLVDGDMIPLRQFRSKYMYEIGERLGFGTTQQLNKEYASKLIEKAKWLQWDREINAYLLIGWCVIAPFCGVLPWRPHIWVTGPAGSGKSWVMDNMIKILLGESPIVVQGKTTEPGVRGLLQNDARPVQFDESDVDSNNDKERIQSILALARSSSYSNGGVIGKGTQSGGSRTYEIRSCFAFSSIGVQLNQQSDRSRFTMLGLLSFENVNRTKEDFSQFELEWRSLVTDEYVKALQSRTISLLPVIIKNSRTFADAVASVIGQRRIGDQVGGMLAGAYSLTSNSEITYEKAVEWVKHRDWNEERALELTKDEFQLFSRLMGHITRIEGTSGTVERSIGELILASCEHLDLVGIAPVTASDRLRRLGFLVKKDRILISNTAEGVKSIIRGTSWEHNHNRILERLPGAEKSDPIDYFPGGKSRGTSLPLSMLSLEIIVKKEDELPF